MGLLYSQVAGNNRPLYPKVDHYGFKVACNCEPRLILTRKSAREKELAKVQVPQPDATARTKAKGLPKLPGESYVVPLWL